jgi:hypothetical protein
MRMASIEVPHYWTDDRGIGFGRLRGSRIHLPPSMRPRAGDTLSGPLSQRVSFAAPAGPSVVEGPGDTI